MSGRPDVNRPRDGSGARGARGLTAIDGAIALLAIQLIVQMWLLTAALENALAGHAETALPAAIVSGLIGLAVVGLYAFICRVDVSTE